VLTSAQKDFLTKVYQAASGVHIFPGAAAAEAALESSWGTSKLCKQANNLFGLKKPSDWTGPTVSIPTAEFLDGEWKTIPATWPVFPSWAECMGERMRIFMTRPMYHSVFMCQTPTDYIMTVSPIWSTGPERADEVLSIYNHHRDILR
jgi:flagellar protein FlgJ